ncbi:hypothetical protein KC316_g8177 [Hortaea werneckii]|uniref:FAD-binding PCMH-type domain-containing protein n=1 Tax=Hortaea werneckii TaxID=91943 RepID=A0A3M6YK19_HORWE|nr:hypothetical protein KC324_g8129 [Hortaea werneckii]KAI7581894.1 hypothetical protein KC316_g8177 [Hortaea werneckii]RMY03358.1 hypothetical protein D0868_07509 [Hortaea werneckii]
MTANAYSTAQIPGDYCWPKRHEWDSLNSTVNGQLIKTEPVAKPCYDGIEGDAEQCATIVERWNNATFQANDPVGFSYPINSTCPPVANGTTSTSCTLGTSPRYAVNATCTEDVTAAVSFAARQNVRLVIKDTGHDILGRSTGYGSLEVWLRHLRTGVEFEPAYQSQCSATDWYGSAVYVGGGYTFEDVYKVAEDHNVIVVGGGTPTVGALGGWMQGGGHGPASRNYGLGADQVLEAQVVLSDGCVVTANPCENSDIFWAIRGGGPGTYGVVISTTVKAYPMVSVQVQHLAMAPLQDSNSDDLLDAIAILYAAYPDLNDGGYAGYGSWTLNSPTPVFANFTTGYVHGFYAFDSDLPTIQSVFAPTLERLKPFNMTSLYISLGYVSYSTYWDFFNAESGVEPAVGVPAAMGSRLFSRSSVQDDDESLRRTIAVIAGRPEENASNNFELVSGGINFQRPADYSGVNPAWRKSYFSNIVSRGWALNASDAVVQSVYDDVVFTKQAAMEAQAPDTGAYMNEASWVDPNYKDNFYGDHYKALLQIKDKRDPWGVFYCQTCVGSDAWTEDSEGRLCKSRDGGSGFWSS